MFVYVVCLVRKKKDNNATNLIKIYQHTSIFTSGWFGKAEYLVFSPVIYTLSMEPAPNTLTHAQQRFCLLDLIFLLRPHWFRTLS